MILNQEMHDLFITESIQFHPRALFLKPQYTFVISHSKFSDYMLKVALKL